MTALRFQGHDALRAVLAMVPVEIQARGGKVVREPDGALAVEVPALPEGVVRTLVEAGAEQQPEFPGDGQPFLHWAELVPVEPDPEMDLREILFLLPEGAKWLGLAAELVRLGCDDQQLARLSSGQWAIKVRQAPFYTVAKAADGAQWSAYAPQYGRDVWVTVGWTHPHAAGVEVPQDCLLLIGPEGWSVLSTPEWHDISDHIDLVLEPPEVLGSEPPTDRLQVQLRLVPTPLRESPSLWLVPEPIDEVLNSLVQRTPDAMVERLELARFTDRDGRTGAVIRARPGTEPPKLVELQPMVAHPHLAAIFVPVGRMIDPPLQPRTLMRILDPGPGRIGWLDPRGDGFVLRVLEDNAFRLLGDLVLYLAEQEADAVDAWMASTRFEWEPLDLEVAQSPRSERSTRQQTRRQAPAAEPAPPPSAASGDLTHRVRRRVAVVPATGAAQASPEVAEVELQELQSFFLQDQDREDLWAPMGEMHSALGQGREAAICWSRAMWVAEGSHRADLASAWAQRCPAVGELPDHPSVDTVAAVVAHTLAGGPPAAPQQLQDWLSRNDGLLDVRSRWLVRRHVAERCGNDALALARARDAVLSSIGAGLVPARDVPAFMRSSATPEDRWALEQSLRALEGLLIRLAPEGVARPYSQIYARLTLAWAHAALGQPEPVQAAVRAAEEELPHDDELHSVLLGLYRSGLDNALASLPAEAPPPREVIEALEALEAFPKYKVDRLRSQSVAVIREPGADNPFLSFVREDDEELSALPPDELLRGLTQALQQLDDDDPGPGLLRIIRAMVGLAPSDAVGILDAVIARGQTLPHEARIQVLVPVVGVAAAIHRPDRASWILEALESGLQGLLNTAPARAASAARDLGRSLARCRLSGPASGMFANLRSACPSDQPDVRLSLAATHALLGGDVSGEAEAALQLLDGDLKDPERVGVLAAAADLGTSMPLGQAIDLWRQLAPQAGHLPDALSTNSHFALMYLRVVEVLAAAHVHPDRLISESLRSWLDADEHKVRVRIHQEDRF